MSHPKIREVMTRGLECGTWIEGAISAVDEAADVLVDLVDCVCSGVYNSAFALRYLIYAFDYRWEVIPFLLLDVRASWCLNIIFMVCLALATHERVFSRGAVTIKKLLQLALGYHLGKHFTELNAIFSVVALVAVVATVLVWLDVPFWEGIWPFGARFLQ